MAIVKSFETHTQRNNTLWRPKQTVSLSVFNFGHCSLEIPVTLYQSMQ
jgi:hypothetical protein